MRRKRFSQQQRPRSPAERLANEGHLAGASDSLIASLDDLLGADRDAQRVQEAQLYMLNALGPTAPQLRERIAAASTLEALWLAREEMSRVLNQNMGSASARQAMETITALLIGAQPLSRA